MRQPQEIITVLKAAGEETRLRLLFLLAQGELSVKDFTEILGQSQPRISRHLKLLADANMVTRHAEGAWAYYRLTATGAGSALVEWMVAHTTPEAEDVKADREKLVRVRSARRKAANAYFAKIADSWDFVRSLHAPDSAVEAAILAAMPSGKLGRFLDLGTGTGRMLELLAAHYKQGVGLDSSREMLSVARSKLDAAGVSHAQVRLGDIADLSGHGDSADLVMMHQVLHYFDDPGLALAAAAQCLTPDGTLMVVDFAPHELEFLRAEHAHRRLGLSDAQMQLWAGAVGLDVKSVEAIPPQTDEGLTVCIWQLGAANSNTNTRSDT